tara:strand:+ start:1318 stop:1458 length:141 start_codon:yes stop_codon:yes gene_type:complete
MTTSFGIAMFFYSMGALLIGSLITYFVIKKIEKGLHEKKKTWNDLE